MKQQEKFMSKRLIRLVALQVLARLMFRVKIRGDHSVFNADRLLVVANHESFLDGLLLGLFLPIDPVFVVYTGVVRNRWFRAVLPLVDYLAVDPISPMAMKQVVKLVKSGRPVVIFPEGRITVTGSQWGSVFSKRHGSLPKSLFRMRLFLPIRLIVGAPFGAKDATSRRLQSEVLALGDGN